MKKLYFFSIALLLVTSGAMAQISTLPASENFDAAFTTGTSVMFIPNWTGNTVATSNRIFQDSNNPAMSVSACAAIPTSSFSPEIKVDLDLSGYANTFATFYAASEANGSGSRPVILRLSTSIDGGATYSVPVQIGNDSTFANASTSYAQYTYNFPFNTNQQSNVILRILGTRGSGSGTTAKILLDEFAFDTTGADVVPPMATGAVVVDASTIKVGFDEPLNGTADVMTNYTGLPTIASAARFSNNDSVLISLATPLTNGTWYTLTVNNVEDMAGNAMAAPQDFTLVFNNNVGNIIITEIMYNNPGTDSLEFLEIRNMDNTDINIGGWRFSSGLALTFPSNLTINAGEYLVFTRYKAYSDAFYGINSVEWLNQFESLNNSGEKVSISNSEGTLIDEVEYDDFTPWDSLADGFGYSLSLCDETLSNDVAANWSTVSAPVGIFNGTTINAHPENNCAGNVGIEDVANSDILIFPNPAMDKLQVEMKNSSDYVIHIYNMQGQLVLKDSFTGTYEKVNINRLPTGLYNLLIKDLNNNRLANNKFTKI
ncbi:MAG: T9SS type A sorting domain-containing protein [Bacteroidia bacterium]|nr:T9SS type A sorting domain-containing protein [Bacteroidia bacterium]